VNATVIIPALNEEEAIGGLVARVPRASATEVIVVDNGSTDATAAVAKAAGARVVVERCRGYGAACWAGVAALRDDVSVAAFLDGDGSQRPEELPRVLEPILLGRADLVLGARALTSGTHPLHAALGTRLVSAFIRRRYGVAITDIGPFRAIRVELLHRLRMRDRAFGWPVEMVVKAAALRARIIEVPVTHAPRVAGRSKVSGTLVGTVRAGYAFIATALRAARDVTAP